MGTLQHSGELLFIPEDPAETLPFLFSLPATSPVARRFMHVCVLSRSVAQSCPTLCNPMDCSLPESSVHGIFHARILEWVTISYPRDLPDPGIELASPAWAGGFFAIVSPGKPRRFVPTSIIASVTLW